MPLRPFHPRTTVFASCAIVCSVVLGSLAWLPSSDAPVLRAQSDASQVRYMPDLRSSGSTTGPLPSAWLGDPPLADSPDGALGIEGFGYSTIDLYNAAAGTSDVRLALTQRGRNPQSFTLSLGGRVRETFRLGRQQRVGEGFWAGKIQGNADVHGVVRSDWRARGAGASGGTAALQAVMPATRLLLPLFSRGVDGMFSDYYIMNADESGDDRQNVVTLQVFNAVDGGIEGQWEHELAPGDVVSVDAQEIGTALTRIPSNLPGGNFVGGFHVSADHPVAMMAYHNEAFEGGVAAVPVRAQNRAAAEHYLPQVRANMHGDSLIGVLNREDQPVDVTVRYRGAPDSPQHAGEEVEQTFSMAPRSTLSIDLAGRGMGTGDAPELRRGNGVDTGFLGSASIEASGRVVASVLESTRAATITVASAAWNSFTPDDLGTAFAVPAVRHVAGKRVTELVVHNPGEQPASATAVIMQEGGSETTIPLVIPAGESRRAVTSGNGDYIARMLLASDRPVAVLVYETPFLGAGDRTTDDLDTVAYHAPRVQDEQVGPPPPSVTPNPTEATPEITPTATDDGRGPPTGTPTDGPAATIFLPFGNTGAR